MASELERLPPADDTIVVNSDADTQITQVDEAWPVTELYRVEPEDAPLAPGEPVPESEPLGTSIPPATKEIIVAQNEPSTVPSRRLWFPERVGAGLMLAIAATLGAIILAAVLLGAGGDDPDTVNTPTTAVSSRPTTPATTMPAPTTGGIALRDLEGMTLEEARALLDAQGLRVRVRRLESDRPPGEILRLEPPAGTTLEKGSVVVLVASKGAPVPAEPTTEVVPGVVGLSASDAVAAIRDAGLEARVRIVESSERAGTVLRQTPPANSEASTDTTVVLDVAKSRPAAPAARKIEVPELVGRAASDARQALRAAGLTVTVVSVPSHEPAGTVVRQSPSAGTELREGGTVKLSVSSGPAKIDIPDVTGLDEQAARTELESAGFEVRVTDEPTTDPAQDGIVIGESPAGGSSAAEGTTVTLTIARLG